MKILFVISSMAGGGAERVAALLCNYWVNEGHSVTLVLTASERSESRYPLDPRVRFDSLGDRVGGIRKTVFNKLRRLFALRVVLRGYRPDVVVSFMYDVNIATVIAKIGMRMALVVSEHIHPPMHQSPFWGGVVRKMFYAKASRVVVLTGTTAEWMQTVLSKDMIQIIPNPVVYPLPSTDSAVLPLEQCVTPGRRLLLSCARFEAQKNLPLLVKAFSATVDVCPDWDLVILGDGRERAALEDLRTQLGLEGRVWLPGWASNLPEWYERADLFVLSSAYEGFGNVLIEAMAYGVPVISTDCPAGPADIVRDGVDGLLISLESGVEGLRDGLLCLMTQDSLRENMGRAAVEVRERFSMKRIASVWGEVLKSAIASISPRSR